MMSWAAWVEGDATVHRFAPHWAARRTSRRVLELHLDPGVLSAAADTIEQAIEAVWHTRGFRVEVVWRPGGHALLRNGSGSSDGDEIRPYLLEYSPEWGGRAYVNHSRRIMRLYNDVRITSFAHEVGHILGFPDRYYTRFDRGRCRYYVDANEADLMSSSSTGHLSAEDFRILKDGYPFD
jgi:hypothetical protein